MGTPRARVRGRFSQAKNFPQRYRGPRWLTPRRNEITRVSPFLFVTKTNDRVSIYRVNRSILSSEIFASILISLLALSERR